jgi:hypothetical protein
VLASLRLVVVLAAQQLAWGHLTVAEVPPYRYSLPFRSAAAALLIVPVVTAWLPLPDRSHQRLEAAL